MVGGNGRGGGKGIDGGGTLGTKMSVFICTICNQHKARKKSNG